MQAADFWNDQKNAAAVSQKVSELKEEIATAEVLEKELADLKELAGMEAAQDDLQKPYNQLEKKIEASEFKAFLSGTYDKKNAILEIFSGAGGQDAQDWATMLLRMYERYCAKKGWKISIMHQSFGDGGGPEGRIGTKNVTMEIRGSHAYGFLKKEAGGARPRRPGMGLDARHRRNGDRCFLARPCSAKIFESKQAVFKTV